MEVLTFQFWTILSQFLFKDNYLPILPTSLISCSSSSRTALQSNRVFSTRKHSLVSSDVEKRMILLVMVTQGPWCFTNFLFVQIHKTPFQFSESQFLSINVLRFTSEAAKSVSLVILQPKSSKCGSVSVLCLQEISDSFRPVLEVLRFSDCLKLNF